VRPRSGPLLLAAALAVACGDRAAETPPSAGGPPALEQAITADLSARVGAPVVVRCLAPLGVPLACDVRLPDGTALPVTLHDGGSAWEWAIAGRLVAAAPIEAYVRDVVGDLGAPQTVACGPALRQLPPDERVECHLGHGGAAFVTVGSDGTLAVEVELDPAAAAARGQPVTRTQAVELEGLSRALGSGSADE
jgi:hypothetical protein